jgi:hypothetical protein
LGLLSRLSRLTSRLPRWAGMAAESFLGKRDTIGYVGCVGTHNIGDALMLPLFKRELGTEQLQVSLGFGTIEHGLWSLACRRRMRACILGGGTLVFGHHYYVYLSRAVEAGVPSIMLEYRPILTALKNKLRAATGRAALQGRNQ